MKKVVVTLSIVILSLPFLFADTMSWKWRGNDEEVNYYRYRVDDMDWKTVGKESYEVRYDLDSSIPHTFLIQQSYDGENWSETALNEYKPIIEYRTEKSRAYSRVVLSLNLIPQQNVTIRNANTGVEDFYAEYSYGMEANATLFLNRILGFGTSFTLNGGIKKIGQEETFLNYGVYGVPTIRIVSNDTLEVSLKGGIGVEIEPYEGVSYISPSFMAGINALVPFGNHFALSISPSIVFSRQDFLGESEYEGSYIRILSVGAAWTI